MKITLQDAVQVVRVPDDYNLNAALPFDANEYWFVVTDAENGQTFAFPVRTIQGVAVEP